MTKAELIEKIVAKTGMSKNTSEKVLKAFLESVEETLGKESKLALSGLGTFVVEQRSAREGRNPRTGETLTIPACKIVKFRPGKQLKDALN